MPWQSLSRPLARSRSHTPSPKAVAAFAARTSSRGVLGCLVVHRPRGAEVLSTSEFDNQYCRGQGHNSCAEAVVTIASGKA